MATGYWNHNVHYHRVVLDAVPADCRTALDVGCGDGGLASELARLVGSVTGVDRSGEMIRLARERRPARVAFVQADFLVEGSVDHLAPESYEFVTAVAVVHHVGFERAVRAMVRLLAPGGRLVIIGLARNRTPLDWVVSGAGLPVARIRARLHGGKTAPAGMPVRPPDLAWGEARREARRLLPGCRYRRRLLWRYSVVWDKPAASENPVRGGREGP
ncbi:SAM-dependent methyltransferase [Kitasatospora sp. MMS16-BH015]|uniref:class I SAM-dependent methyltransferase n=1 Tax=Kitasatospora sp. MMS16-BH015 TaxID=2018025 RepID=UPI000CA09AED|nr:class I SAM-dependent methyltransferase [Kitasatospora sp. MMS16-BH015]AUG75068.1 SAM-dependent methyltransferase [Kitasatospora sp. MMS16-BH015]